MQEGGRVSQSEFSPELRALPWLPEASTWQSQLLSQHTRTTSIWLPLQPALTLQLLCLPVSLRLMLSHDLCLPTVLSTSLPLPGLSSPFTSAQFLLLPWDSAQASPASGSLPCFSPGWVRVLSRPHNTNHHSITAGRLCPGLWAFCRDGRSGSPSYPPRPGSISER